MRTLPRLAASTIILALAVAAGCTEAATRTDAPVISATQARFEAVVYQVEVPADRIADLNRKEIESKAAALDFEKALAALGKTKLLYKVDQPVVLTGDTITVGSSVPFVTASRVMADTGRTVNTVQYQRVGAIFTFGTAPPAGHAAPEATPALPAARLNVDIAGIADSAIEISPGVKAPVMSSVKFSQNGPFRSGRPVVAISFGDTSAGAKSTPIAYVIRYVVSEMK
jgi:hypothetical protein